MAIMAEIIEHMEWTTIDRVNGQSNRGGDHEADQLTIEDRSINACMSINYGKDQ
jgi:hypothetical protein